jgi:DtxR family transcriptional regulator, manganese transport regulator
LSNKDLNNESTVKITSTNTTTRLQSIRDANNAKKEQDRTARMEDYLEVIYELIQQKGYATIIEISEYLNVSSPSVTKMMQRLHESGHITYEKYRGISLKDEGIVVATYIRNRHGLFAEFLKIIGVDEYTANRDAEGIEHHLHPESIKKLEKFINILKKNPALLE